MISFVIPDFSACLHTFVDGVVAANGATPLGVFVHNMSPILARILFPRVTLYLLYVSVAITIKVLRIFFPF